MITLMKRSEDRYIVAIESDGFMEEYDFKGAVSMLLYLAVPTEEIEAAMVSLLANNHYVAEFGFFNTFLFSRPAVAPIVRAA